MGFFRKKTDPISERARTLNSEIAALEEQIKQLNSKIERDEFQPKTRSTAFPSHRPGQPPSAATVPPAVPQPKAPSRDPIFETVEPKRVSPPKKPTVSGGPHGNLRTGKSRLEKGFRRVADLFQAPPARNPKLVSYLAAGSIRGLRPLRYEKRIARNRTLTLSIILLLLLWGIYAAFLRQH